MASLSKVIIRIVYQKYFVQKLEIRISHNWPLTILETFFRNTDSTQHFDPKRGTLAQIKATFFLINFEIPAALVFQLEVYYKVDRFLTSLTAQQIGTTAQWYSNKAPLYV